MYYLGIDIGGTWIKSALVHDSSFSEETPLSQQMKRLQKVKSPLHINTNPNELVESLKELIANYNINPEELSGIGISTPGIVDYKGTKVLEAAKHLAVLTTDHWKKTLEDQLHCPAVLINDADAATIGLAKMGYLNQNRTIGVMSLGTGLGFSVWKNGRRWRPGKIHTLVGSIQTPNGSFDALASASKLASLDKNLDLINVLMNASFDKQRNSYLENLVKIIYSVATLYNLDEIILCGGLADAVVSCAYPLEQILRSNFSEFPEKLQKSIKIVIAREGNNLQMIGALALAKGEIIANLSRVELPYDAIDTEIPYNKDLQLEKMSTSDVIETLWEAEQKAGASLKESLPIIEKVVTESVKRMKHGGRIIYVGAGTSGRIAAMDAVEIPCTYGFPEDCIMSIISGGISDAAIEIESDFEEDASAVPEMLLLNIKPEDVVIGISASGTAYFVQSALAFAKYCGAFSVLIQSKYNKKNLAFCDSIIPLNSGNEVIAGSTRMKAGTATKKVLNFLSSTIMIRLGKVAGSYMNDMACINDKLVERAKGILMKLYHINYEEAERLLMDNNFDLQKAIDEKRRLN
jgi:N-acetylmuramic acid 6-phosphate etherase